MDTLDPSQERAVELMCTAPFGVVTGGPGTGKTTSVRAALDRLDEQRETYALAAPTGKAAKRMSEATGREASTIHRLLGWTPFGWTYHRHRPLPFDLVLIDEASMIDTQLAASLVDAIGPDTRLVMVGDANQLPSVGPGRVLADLVESDAVPVARLTHVHRAAAESWVCRNAPRVLAGEKLELQECPDFRFVEAETALDVRDAVVQLMAAPELQGAQVLVPQRNTVCGVEALNAALQAKLNPAGRGRPEWKIGERTLRQGDAVIQTVNNYSLEVFNGEVGTVAGFDDEKGTMVVDMGDRRIAYEKGTALNLQLAYALTIHKSQGSEFSWVICVVHSSHSYMLTRQLFYTAITRAKKGVVLVGNRKGIATATGDKKPPKRNTALVARMQEILPTNGGGSPRPRCETPQTPTGVCAAGVDHVPVAGGSFSAPGERQASLSAVGDAAAMGDEISW